MTRRIPAIISVGLKELLIKEKKKLQAEEKKKKGSRRKKITLIDASQSLVRQLR